MLFHESLKDETSSHDTVTMTSATQMTKLKKKRVEREDLRDSEHNQVKMLMKKLLCHDRMCKNKKNQC